MSYIVIQGDSERELNKNKLKKISFFKEIDLSFIDPPFNQNKYYPNYNDNLPPVEYWGWMKRITELIYNLTSMGGAIYFMQREKNTEYVLECLRSSNWILQNLIIWKKKTSAVPGTIRYGKHYQIIAFATKGLKPRVFNRLRIDPPLLENQKYKRVNGMYVTDVWDDIRELTSGYFAGEEPLRKDNGERIHKQQTAKELLLRIILSSSLPGDLILDPFAGLGITSVVAEQLQRNSISMELSPEYVEIINDRLNLKRKADNVSKFCENYKYTENLNLIWQLKPKHDISENNKKIESPPLFHKVREKSSL